MQFLNEVFYYEGNPHGPVWKSCLPPKPFKPAAVFVWEPFLPSLFLMVESMDTDLNWGKRGLQFFRCCCGVFCDLLDELSLHSWGNFGRAGHSWKVHHCSMFSPFVNNVSHCGSLESQSFRNGFITFSRLIDLNYFLSHLFLNFFGSQHDVSLLRIFWSTSLCQAGPIKGYLDCEQVWQ